jgi:hypothetical protein
MATMGLFAAYGGCARSRARWGMSIHAIDGMRECVVVEKRSSQMRRTVRCCSFICGVSFT